MREPFLEEPPACQSVLRRTSSSSVTMSHRSVSGARMRGETARPGRSPGIPLRALDMSVRVPLLHRNAPTSPQDLSMRATLWVTAILVAGSAAYLGFRPSTDAVAAETQQPVRKASGLDKRELWTTSRVKGSPEPPDPYSMAR